MEIDIFVGSVIAFNYNSKGRSYIHNWSLKYFSLDNNLVSDITYVECVNFIREWQDLQFNVDSERQIFENFSWQLYLLSEILPEIY